MLHDGAAKSAVEAIRFFQNRSNRLSRFFANLFRLRSSHAARIPGVSPTASDRQIRPLSPAVRAGDFVHVSGQVPADGGGLQAEGLSPCR